MLRTLIAAFTVMLLVGTAAAHVPLEVDDCLRTADELSDSIDRFQLSEQELDTTDDLIGELEEHCEAKQFTQATQIAEILRARR